jgi:hypothetical protein
MSPDKLGTLTPVQVRTFGLEELKRQSSPKLSPKVRRIAHLAFIRLDLIYLNLLETALPNPKDILWNPEG